MIDCRTFGINSYIIYWLLSIIRTSDSPQAIVKWILELALQNLIVMFDFPCLTQNISIQLLSNWFVLLHHWGWLNANHLRMDETFDPRFAVPVRRQTSFGYPKSSVFVSALAFWFFVYVYRTTKITDETTDNKQMTAQSQQIVTHENWPNRWTRTYDTPPRWNQDFRHQVVYRQSSAASRGDVFGQTAEHVNFSVSLPENITVQTICCSRWLYGTRCENFSLVVKIVIWLNLYALNVE